MLTGLKMAAGRLAADRWVELVAGLAPGRPGLRCDGFGKAGCGERGSQRGWPHSLSAEPSNPLAGPAGESAELASALLGPGVAAPSPSCWWERGSPSHPSQSERGWGDRLWIRETVSCLQLLYPEESCSQWECQQARRPTSESAALSSVPGGDSSRLGIGVWPCCRKACRVTGCAAKQEKVYLSRATLLLSCTL